MITAMIVPISQFEGAVVTPNMWLIPPPMSIEEPPSAAVSAAIRQYKQIASITCASLPSPSFPSKGESGAPKLKGRFML